MNDFQVYLKEKTDFFETELKKELKELSYPETITKGMEYAILNGGKRLRPFLLFVTLELLNEDIKNYKNIFNRDEFDTIVTNPPYFEFTGDISQTNDLEQLANARHNINLSLEEIIKISSYLLKNMGSFSIVFRSERLVEVLALLQKYNLEPKRMKNCYTKWNENSKICLLEAIKDAKKGFSIEMPIFVYDENGQKNEYIENLYKS